MPETMEEKSTEEEKKTEGSVPGNSQSSECYKYEKDGTVVYTDPLSKIEYILDSSGTNWIPKTGSQYKFDGETYFYTDEQTGHKHKWDQAKNEWILCKEEKSEENKKSPIDQSEKESDEESEEDESTTDKERREKQFRKRKAIDGWGQKGTHHTDPETGVPLYRDGNDGMLYEWDAAKNAWFPRIDEDFMAVYQMNYGFTPDGKAEPTLPSEPSETPEEKEASEAEAKKARKEEAAKKKPQWFQEDQTKSAKVYVSNLPDDTDEEEFVKLMSKCGVVDVDIRTNKPKIKLYRDENGIVKGDGLCSYVKVESVELALTIIDGSTVHSKGGRAHVLKVERAKFEMKGSAYDPTKKPKKLGKKELEKVKKRHDKLLAWIPDQARGVRKKTDKVIVIENVFNSADFDKDASLILECSSKLREHCSKFGTVTKVVVYDKNPNGICQVFFKTPEEADVAISMLDGRLFTKICGPMKCYTWDGKTKYKTTETAEEEKARLDNWEKFLKEVEDEDKPAKS